MTTGWRGKEPCLCGAEDCKRCHPENFWRDTLDDRADAEYEEWIQRQLDEKWECENSKDS